MNTLINFYENLKSYEPLIRGGIAILTIFLGWMAGIIANRIVTAFLSKFNFNKALKRLGIEKRLKNAEFNIDGSKFFGKIAEWVVFIIGLMIAFDITGVEIITNLIGKVVSYLPNIIISSLLFIGGIFASDFSYRIVIASTGEKTSYSKLIGSFLRGLIWIFITLAILLQLEIAPEIVKAIIYGIIGAVALAFGIAFGLGGKEIASEILKNFKNKIS